MGKPKAVPDCLVPPNSLLIYLLTPIPSARTRWGEGGEGGERLDKLLLIEMIIFCIDSLKGLQEDITNIYGG